MDNIIWKDVLGYEGLYRVSNTGEIFSVRSNKKLSKCFDKEGYLVLVFSKDGIRENKKVHRLVAEAFIENDDIINKNQINHIDEDKSNNNVTNLEWCTPKYNANWGNRNIKSSEKLSIPIVSININTRIVKYYKSISSVNEENYNYQGVIMCLKNEINTYKDCIWLTYEYYENIKNDIDEYIDVLISKSYNIRKEIISIDENGNELKFKSLREAERNGFCIKNIKNVINTKIKYKDRLWSYACKECGVKDNW